MPSTWQKEFETRMHSFERTRRASPGGVAVSIKVRVASGCFHREHSPLAYEILDRYVERHGAPDADVFEHESGPELLVILALATAGVTLAKSVIDLIAAIIKARSEGIKKGDKPAEPLKLIVRRVADEDGFREEIVLTIGHEQPVDAKVIEGQVAEALKKLVEKKGD